MVKRWYKKVLLIQLPPSLGILEGLERLKQIVPLLDNNYRYAVETRHESGFQEAAYGHEQKIPERHSIEHS
jgi:uncharacterized protein YecE (DUF72 family)